MPTVSEDVTRQVMKHHIQAVIANDPDAINEDYAKDAVCLGAYGPVIGKDAIRQYEARLGEHFEGTKLHWTRIQYSDDMVYFEWIAQKPDMGVVVEGAVTMIIRNGKIVKKAEKFIWHEPDLKLVRSAL